MLKPLEKVYWLRLAAGIVAAFLCTGFGLVTNSITSNLAEFEFRSFLNGLSIALLVYIISYYAIKSKYLVYVSKPQKLLTTGIGIYFIAWIVFWVLLYTIIAGQPVTP
ncbi:MAG: hypothetical protein QHH24_06980 [Candidatus Bathyarchaeota archaeon]|jgi:uncharacterized membrane protein|nr:hypothetical protein [Candidatus Bathyarchaeota archaeon]